MWGREVWGWDVWGRDVWGREVWGRDVWGRAVFPPAGDGLPPVADADAVGAGGAGHEFAAEDPVPQILLLHRLSALWGGGAVRGPQGDPRPTWRPQTHSETPDPHGDPTPTVRP